MTAKPTAETPTPFPTIPNPTPSPASASPDRSYDEIVRKNVPMPDSSHRPLPGEARSAEEPRTATVEAAGGDTAFPSDGAVRAALAGLDAVDVSDLTVSLVGGTATMSGSVARGLDRDRITTALGKIAGVAEIVDHLRIRTE